MSCKDQGTCGSYGTQLSDSTMYGAQRSLLKEDLTAGKLRTATVEPPASFDGLKVWKKYVYPITNQGSCGACWAFAATRALAMRLAIYTAGKLNLKLSPSAMVVCNMGSTGEWKYASSYISRGDPYDYTIPSDEAKVKGEETELVSKVGCNGETILGAWQYLYRFGATTLDCVNYEPGKNKSGLDLMKYKQGQKLPACLEVLGDYYDMCDATKKPSQRVRAGGYYEVPGTADKKGSEKNIREEIYMRGPVSTGFMVHGDFMKWDGKGIYHWNGESSEGDGGHAVVICGWGEENGIKYWQVINSWGDKWGEGGCFRIRRGENECDFEKNIVVGYPDLPGFRLYLEHPMLYGEEDLALRAVWNVHYTGYKITLIERMLDGRLNKWLIDPDTPAIPPDACPNFKTLIAGEPTKIEFPLAHFNGASYVTKFMPLVTMHIGRIHVTVGVIDVLIAAGLIGAGWWYMKKRGIKFHIPP